VVEELDIVKMDRPAVVAEVARALLLPFPAK
jgi:hypothetical protein